MASRRWFYLIPAHGEPVKLSHQIEPFHLDSLPVANGSTLRGRNSFGSCAKCSPGCITSPCSTLPTICYLRFGCGCRNCRFDSRFGNNVVSSADLLSRFEATCTEEQIPPTLLRETRLMHHGRRFSEIGKRARHGGTTEFEIQQWIVEAFQARESGYGLAGHRCCQSKQRHSTLRALGKGLGPNRRRRLRFAGCLGKKEYAWRDILRHQLDGFVGSSLPDHIRKIFEMLRLRATRAFRKYAPPFRREKNFAAGR